MVLFAYKSTQDQMMAVEYVRCSHRPLPVPVLASRRLVSCSGYSIRSGNPAGTVLVDRGRKPPKLSAYRPIYSGQNRELMRFRGESGWSLFGRCSADLAGTIGFLHNEGYYPARDGLRNDGAEGLCGTHLDPRKITRIISLSQVAVINMTNILSNIHIL